MAKKQAQSNGWRNRIIGHGAEAPDQLLAHPDNWRIHPKYQQDALSAVLDNIGWVTDVIVSKNSGRIVDGHLRVSLAISRNEAEVPVVYVDLTEDEELTVLATIDPLSAMAATDSAKLAELLASVQTDDAALEAVLRGVGETAGLDMGGVVQESPDVDVDRAEELRAKWGVETGDLWRVPSKHGGEHRILCGDSTNAADVARVMGGTKADAIVTDPPYGVDYEGGRNPVSNTPRAKLKGDTNAGLYQAFLCEWIKHISKRAVCYIWFAGRKGLEVYGAIHGVGLDVRALIIWNKIDPHYGNFMAQYMQKHEPCLYCVQDATDWYGPTNEVTVWDIKQPTVNEHHPTEKPIECMSRPIANSTTIGNVVADPFLGSGTTAVACEQLARVCYAVEISPAYVSVALERLSLMGLSPVRSDDDAQPA